MMRSVGSTSRLNFKWSDDLVESIRARAEADGVSVNAWVGRALEAALGSSGSGVDPLASPGSSSESGFSRPARSPAPPRAPVPAKPKPAPKVESSGATPDPRFRRCPASGCDFRVTSPSATVTCRTHHRPLLDFGA